MTKQPMPRTVVLLAAAVGLGAAAGRAEDGSGRARHRDLWAIGYAVEVARSCPEWQVERQEVLAERGILPRSDPASGMLHMDGATDREYLRGLTDASTAARTHPHFCLDVRRVAGAKWRRLARVLRSRGEDVPGR